MLWGTSLSIAQLIPKFGKQNWRKYFSVRAFQQKGILLQYLINWYQQLASLAKCCKVISKAQDYICDKSKSFICYLKSYFTIKHCVKDRVVRLMLLMGLNCSGIISVDLNQSNITPSKTQQIRTDGNDHWVFFVLSFCRYSKVSLI